MEKTPKKARHIFVVSDATGETAERMTQAALSQFTHTRTVVTCHRYIRNKQQLEDILIKAKAENGLILYTLVSDDIRKALRERTVAHEIPAVDLMGPLLTTMAGFLRTSPQSLPGLLHKVDTEYFLRIEAVQFTVKHDDGQNLPTIDQADIILVGASRTAKTPLSMYLAHYGFKVANIRVVGLLIDPERLMEVRQARLRKLKQSVTGYADLSLVSQELDYCRELYNQNRGWHILDVTGRAVEEVASDILSILKGNNPLQSQKSKSIS
jgi:regulator of PEP synthase PpsR (kinase-PPPase family)